MAKIVEGLMDKYRIDSHKLIYHVSRVNDWLEGKLTYPIYVEIATSGTCNHRCTYCALDYMEYQRRFLDKNVLTDRLTEMAGLGVKSVMYAGEGEPLLHKEIGDIIVHTKERGIDVAITTNGTPLTEKLSRKILGFVSWIKVSINGATKETYAKIHRSNPEDFDRVIKNISYAVQTREKEGYSCTIGMQLILLPENWQEATSLAEIARDIGADYLVIKPYSQHPMSYTTLYKDVRYNDFSHLQNVLKEYNTEDFQVIFRQNTMKKWDDKERYYKQCLALPFWSYIDAGGNVWGCSAYLGKKDFLYGNIHDCTFQEIWEGEERMKSLGFVASDLDTSRCRVNCRMDEINRYLWDLKHPPAHSNFI